MGRSSRWRRRRARLVRRRHDHAKCASLPLLAFDFEPSGILPDNALADRQAQARALAVLCREEWLEDMRKDFGAYAMAGVADGNPNFLLGCIVARNDVDPPTVGHGVAGVYQQVQEDLFHLRWISYDDGQIRGQVGHDLYVFQVSLIRNQSEGMLENLVQVGRNRFIMPLPGEIEEVADNITASEGFVADDLIVLPARAVFR